MSSFVKAPMSAITVGENWVPYMDNPLVSLREGVGSTYFAFRFPWAIPVYLDFEDGNDFDFFTLYVGVYMYGRVINTSLFKFSKNQVLDILGAKKTVNLEDRVLVEGVRKNSISELYIEGNTCMSLSKSKLADIFSTFDLSSDTSILMVGICYVDKEDMLSTNTAAVRQESYK